MLALTHGVQQIVRFNWPFYALAVAALHGAPPAIAHLPPAGAARIRLYAATGLSALWIVTLAGRVVDRLRPLAV